MRCLLCVNGKLEHCIIEWLIVKWRGDDDDCSLAHTIKMKYSVILMLSSCNSQQVEVK